MAPDPHDETRDREWQLVAKLERAYAAAVVAGDVGAAEDVAGQAIDAGLGEALIHDRIIRPAMVLVGELWADGRITIAQEHLATSISAQVLALLRDAFRVARHRITHRVLLAAAEGERHVLGLEMAGSVMRHAGYDVRQLGADLPVAELSAAVDRHVPTVVGFTSATVTTAANLPPAFHAVREVNPAAGIVVGGGGVDERLAMTWDVVLCRQVGDAIHAVDALVKRARRN